MIKAMIMLFAVLAAVACASAQYYGGYGSSYYPSSYGYSGYGGYGSSYYTPSYGYGYGRSSSYAYPSYGGYYYGK